MKVNINVLIIIFIYKKAFNTTLKYIISLSSDQILMIFSLLDLSLQDELNDNRFILIEAILTKLLFVKL